MKVEYEGLVQEWLEARGQEQNPSTSVLAFLEGRVDRGVEREKVLVEICDYLAYYYLMAGRVMEGMIKVAKASLH